MMSMPIGSDATIVLVILAMFALMAVGVPIFIAIGIAALGGLWAAFGLQQAMINFTSFLWQSLNSFELVTIPLFVFAAILVQESDVGDELFDFAKVWVGSIPNGLGVAVIVSCAIFAGICGSSPVTAVTIGLIALPALAREGYPDNQRGAMVAAGGTLGILIPPSVPLIIYGVLTQTSIGSLFVATVIPGLLLAAIFAVYVMFAAGHRTRARGSSWSERISALYRAFPVVILPLFIIGSIYFGLITPTETGAMAALYLLLLGVMRRRLSVTKIWRSAMLTALTSAMLLMIFATGSVLARYTAILQVPQRIAEAITSVGSSPLLVFTGMVVADLILGTFLESGALTILTIPIFFPIAMAIGLDPLQFGVMIAVNQEIAQIHPPAGLNLVTVASISDIPLTRMMVSILPYIAIEIGIIYALYFFPQLTLYLSSQMAFH
jgi:C4-dicarboxylate transporter, DctM subunit